MTRNREWVKLSFELPLLVVSDTFSGSQRKRVQVLLKVRAETNTFTIAATLPEVKGRKHTCAFLKTLNSHTEV